MDPNGPAEGGRSPRSESRLPELTARLRAAGWDPTPQELAEALWLARWTGSSVREPGAVSPGPGAGRAYGTTAERPGHPLPTGEERPDSRPDPVSPDSRAPAASTVSLFAPDRHDSVPGNAFPVRAPAAGTHAGLLDVQRAMRPLLGYRPPAPSLTSVLDEEASAEQSARCGAVTPVFSPPDRSEAELLLLMDASATASVWQLAFDKLRQTCERLGAFRDVQALHLHRGGDGAPLVGTGPDPRTTRLRPADQYRDPTGRRLTLVVSDCVGPLWQDGRAQRLLHRWLGSSPVAVVQPLPPRLWRRTALPGEPGRLIRDKGPGGPVTFDTDGYGPPPPDDARPLPVLLPTRAALGNWARLQGGEGRQTARGAAAWVRPRHPAMPVPQERRRNDAQGLVRDFTASASPGAVDLAVHLAAVPLVLPVIELVQEAMLPDTGPMELAEVLLSGLLNRLPDVEDAPGPRYEYVHGVQELLLQSLDQGAAELVLKHLSEYVERRYGKGTRNFPAMAVAKLANRPVEEATEEDPAYQPPDELDELFAQIPARVVRQYVPERETAADPVSRAELLLRRWRAQADPWLLDEARRYADDAVAAARDASGEGLARAKFVLGQILHAMARTAPVRRDPERVRKLLSEAAIALDECSLSDETADARIELAAVRYDLWQVLDDPGFLRSAVRTLRSMEGRTPRADRTARVEAERRLWLGKSLLELSRAGDRVEPVQPSYEEQAAAELGAAADLLESVGRRGRRLCAVLLDRCAALRRAGASVEERLANLDRAEAAAAGDAELRLRCGRERARAHRYAGDLAEAEAAYAEAETYTKRYSTRRAELLMEWGVMLLQADDEPQPTTENARAVVERLAAATGAASGNRAGRAEGLLREALTIAPAEGALAGRLQVLLGRALVDRFHREGFRPDLYEGCHMLEQAARKKALDPELRADAWLMLGRALDAEEGGADRAVRAFTESLEEARRIRRGTPGSVAAARALAARASANERCGRRADALADHRAAREEWHQLAGRLAEDIPWDEVLATSKRITELESDDG